jgi:hypothetical protein
VSYHNHEAKTHTHGLQDDCPRCAEYVKEPHQLDGENMRRLWSGRILTKTDMQAYNALYRAAVLTQRLEEAFMYALVDGKPERVLERHDVDLWEHGGRA